ncbi:hypothetical protein K7432_008099 [Basidiobolus ranarum]|uniref:Uncharacterized protein n=1 Tax=Basidiobolus ranarum TaxID=34480 RepID=A0ABR2VZ47_9FUNG
MGNSYQQRIAELERLEKVNSEKENKTTVLHQLNLQDLDISSHFNENSSDEDLNVEQEETNERMLRRFQDALESRQFHQQLLVSQAVLRNRIRQRLESPLRPENSLMEILARYSGDIEMDEV